MKYTVRCNQESHSIKINRKQNYQESFEIPVDDKTYTVSIDETYSNGEIKTVIINNKVYPVEIFRRQDGFPGKVSLNGISYDVDIEKVESTRYRPPVPPKQIKGEIYSSLPGVILELLVEEGSTVKKGEPVLILEAMKMENMVLSPKDGTVKKIIVSKDQNIMKGDLLVEID